MPARRLRAGIQTHARGETSEEHTSELQSRRDLVCRPLLEKKNEGEAKENEYYEYQILHRRRLCCCRHRDRNACCCASRGNGHAALFFFNDTATTEIYTLSLHDALPI